MTIIAFHDHHLRQRRNLFVAIATNIISFLPGGASLGLGKIFQIAIVAALGKKSILMSDTTSGQAAGLKYSTFTTALTYK